MEMVGIYTISSAFPDVAAQGGAGDNKNSENPTL